MAITTAQFVPAVRLFGAAAAIRDALGLPPSLMSNTTTIACSPLRANSLARMPSQGSGPRGALTLEQADVEALVLAALARAD